MKTPVTIYAKQDAIRKAFDELPELLERINEQKPFSPSLSKIKDALMAYSLGLPSNPVRVQKQLIHHVDSGVSLVLCIVRKYHFQGFDIDKFKVVYDLLETSHGEICEAIEVEENRQNEQKQKAQKNGIVS